MLYEVCKCETSSLIEVKLYSKPHAVIDCLFFRNALIIRLKACFKRRATAVLSWLDCGSTTARH